MKLMRAGKVIMLFVVFVILLTSFGCKKKEFSIVGNWNINYSVPGDSGSMVLSFQGSDDSGDVINTGGADIGNYTVAGDSVNFTLAMFWNNYLGNLVLAFRGTSSDDNNMGGSVNLYFSNFPTDQDTGSWTGTR